MPKLSSIRLKRNRAYQGDCLDLMKYIEPKSIDMILCDLPYGTTACKWDTIIPFVPLWEQYNRVIKDGGAIVLTASQPFTSALVMSNIKLFRYEWIWNKGKGSNPLLSKKQPMKSHENILVFSKRQTKYIPQMTVGQKYAVPKTGGNRHNRIIGSFADNPHFVQKTDPTKRFPVSIQNYSIHCGSKLHPTQKPVALFEYLIKTYTNKGDLVLDNCAGSGTTGIACLNTDRDFILIEKLPEYVDVINQRIAEHHAKTT
jgi:site-specific DNA-methyltransferase (adenine-specific)